MAKRKSSIDPIFDEDQKTGFRKYAVLGFLVILIGFILYAAFAGGGSSSGPVPIVQADNTPWTRAPEDTGGMEIPNQDSTVFDLMRDEESTEITDTQDDVLESAEAEDDTQETVTTKETKEAVVTNVEIDDTKTNDDPIGDLIEDEVKDEKEADTTVSDKPAQIPTLQPSSSGNVMLRLGAVPSNDTEVARQEFARLQKLSGGVLDGKTPSFESVSLPEKGDFVRINVSATSSEADDICKALIAKNAPCLILK